MKKTKQQHQHQQPNQELRRTSQRRLSRRTLQPQRSKGLRKVVLPPDSPEFLLSYDEGLLRLGEEELRTLLPHVGYTCLSATEILITGTSAYSFLKIPHALFRRIHFPVSRPRALLGHENLQRLLAAISETSQRGGMSTFRLSAAGTETPVFQRLRQAIVQDLSLTEDEKEGELLIRIRASQQTPGWEVLLRVTPKPLSARSWRSIDIPGSLNGSLAAALVRATAPTSNDVFIDLTCGSGTILIERALCGPAARIIGVDISTSALTSATEHLSRAGVHQVELVAGDVCKPLPFAQGAFSVLVGNLPWGERIGKRLANKVLYQGVCERLQELAAPHARAAFLTQDHATFRETVYSKLPQWVVISETKISQRGFNPVLFLLKKMER